MQNRKANIGDIEIATMVWFSWDGKVPADFEDSWLEIDNKAQGKMEYTPHIVVELE